MDKKPIVLFAGGTISMHPSGESPPPETDSSRNMAEVLALLRNLVGDESLTSDSTALTDSASLSSEDMQRVLDALPDSVRERQNLIILGWDELPGTTNPPQ